MSAVKKPMRLPPLKALRVRNPDVKQANPCITVMNSVLSCWASAGYTAQGCAAVEQSLRACMDGPPAPKAKKSEINYHLSRMYPKIVGPRKPKKC